MSSCLSNNWGRREVSTQFVIRTQFLFGFCLTNYSRPRLIRISFSSWFLWIVDFFESCLSFCIVETKKRDISSSLTIPFVKQMQIRKQNLWGLNIVALLKMKTDLSGQQLLSLRPILLLLQDSFVLSVSFVYYVSRRRKMSNFLLFAELDFIVTCVGQITSAVWSLGWLLPRNTQSWSQERQSAHSIFWSAAAKNIHSHSPVEIENPLSVGNFSCPAVAQVLQEFRAAAHENQVPWTFIGWDTRTRINEDICRIAHKCGRKTQNELLKDKLLPNYYAVSLVYIRHVICSLRSFLWMCLSFRDAHFSRAIVPNVSQIKSDSFGPSLLSVLTERN